MMKDLSECLNENTVADVEVIVPGRSGTMTYEEVNPVSTPSDVYYLFEKNGTLHMIPHTRIVGVKFYEPV